MAAGEFEINKDFGRRPPGPLSARHPPQQHVGSSWAPTDDMMKAACLDSTETTTYS